MQENIEISVIIATYNRADMLANTLNSFLFQTLEKNKFEIIVVDDGSNDNTLEVVNSFKKSNEEINLKLIKHETNLTKATACNTGILKSEGKIIAFIDDDICATPNWLRKHLEFHKLWKTPIAVTGLVLYPSEWEKTSNWILFANQNYRKSLLSIKKSRNVLSPSRFAGGNSSISKEILLSVGGFKNGMRRGEDVELACKLHLANIPIYFEPEALVYHYSKIIWSIDETLEAFKKYYVYDRKIISENYPWLLEKYAHWFLEAPNKNYDNIYRILIKNFVNTITDRKIQGLIILFLKKTDKKRWLYLRPFHLYVMACEAVYAIKLSKKN